MYQVQQIQFMKSHMQELEDRLANIEKGLTNVDNVPSRKRTTKSRKK